MRICRSALERQLSKLLGSAIEGPVIFEPSIDAEKGKMASWWRMVKNLEQEQKHDISLFVDGPILAHVEEMLIAGLLYGQPHNYTEALTRVTTITVPIYVRRAQSYLHEHARQNLTIENIVAASGGSPIWDDLPASTKSALMNCRQQPWPNATSQKVQSPVNQLKLTDVRFVNLMFLQPTKTLIKAD